jgi:hypothetical protein
MVSNDYVQKALYNDLNRLGVSSVIGYAREHRDFLDNLYGKSIIDDASIDKAVENMIFIQAKKDFKKILISSLKGREMFLDNPSVHPECMIYAWQKNVLTDMQFIQIPIDHGYTMATIGDRHNTKELVSSLRKIVLTEKFQPSAERIPHSCCYW